MSTRFLRTALTLWPGVLLAATECFVSPTGSDANPGTAERPFATVRRAQTAVRSARRQEPAAGITVRILPGRYELDRPLEFGPGDSGASADMPVVYRAEPGAEVVLSAGRRITGWQPDPAQPGVWKTRVAAPDVGDDLAWRFEQLWVNDRRAVRARTPNDGEFHSLRSVTEDGAEPGGSRPRHRFGVKPTTLTGLQGLADDALRDVQVVVFHKWDTTRERLESVDPASGTFTTRGDKMQSWNSMTRNCLYYLENFAGALDAPGEWFLDRHGWLFYRPRPGENLATADVVAPRLDRFLEVRGRLEQPDQRVRHLHFEGLKFRHAEYRVPPEGLTARQAAMNAPQAALLLDGADGVVFRRCAVEHIGSTAIWFRKACRNSRLEQSRLFDLGVAGVRIGEPELVPEPVRTGGITVDNCIIQSGGRILHHTVGVWIGHNADNALTHCDIGDFYYTGVSVGWRWGYDASGAKRNRIEYNHIHHLGYRILSDMGGVYTLGPSEGTSVSHNWIHDVYATTYGGWGLYPDEGSTGIVLEGNLVHDVKDGGFHQHYGKDNVVRNNIFAFSQEGQIAVTRAEPHRSFTFERNLVYWDRGQLFGYSGWKAGAKVDLHHNLYWRADGQPFDCAGRTWEQWQAAGNDTGSLIANPRFVDATRRDFRLQPDSPATGIGFKPFDYTQAGVYGDPAWRQLARGGPYPQPYTVPPPEPLSFREDFETGDGPPLSGIAALDQEGRRDLIRVTNEVAHRGRRALRVQDSPDLKAGYNPHFYWDPELEAGAGRLAYALRLDPGAVVHCEWRSAGHPYRVGPSLVFRDGAAYSRDRKLLDVPANAWIEVEMRASFGKPQARWTLDLKFPNGEPHHFADLPCDPDWTTARWMGFSASSGGTAGFYLDDLAQDFTREQ